MSSNSSSCSPFISALAPSSQKRRELSIINSNLTPNHNNNNKKRPISLNLTPKRGGSSPSLEKFSLLLFQSGAFLASVGAPAALAVTGENGGDDLVTTLVSGGIVAFVYLFVVPPILMQWMRLRWYKRKLLEMYLQFMFVFIFFPGLLLWAPFINFRKFPRDPTMEYPWSTPKDDVPLYKSR